MKNLLRADIVRLLKSGEFFILLLLLFLYAGTAHILGFSYLFFGDSLTSGADVFSGLGHNLFLTVAALFSALYFCRNLSPGPIGMKIGAGHSKTQIAASLFTVWVLGQLTAVCAGYALDVLLIALRKGAPAETEDIYIGLPYQESVTIGTPDAITAAGVLKDLILFLPGLLAVIALCFFAAICARKRLKTLVIVVIFLGLMFHFADAAMIGLPEQYVPDPQFNYDEALRDDMTADEIRAVFDSVPLVENPDYPGPFGIFLRRLFNDLNPAYCSYLLREIVFDEVEEPLHDMKIPREYILPAVCSCCEATLFPLAGFLIFKKRDAA